MFSTRKTSPSKKAASDNLPRIHDLGPSESRALNSKHCTLLLLRWEEKSYTLTIDCFWPLLLLRRRRPKEVINQLPNRCGLTPPLLLQNAHKTCVYLIKESLIFVRSSNEFFKPFQTDKKETLLTCFLFSWIPDWRRRIIRESRKKSWNEKKS